MVYNNPYYINIKQDTGFKNSLNQYSQNTATGLSSFSASGGNPYVTAGAVVTNQIMGGLNTVQNEKRLANQFQNTNRAGLQYDQFGRPIYNSDVSISDIQNTSTNDIGRFKPQITDAFNPSGTIKLLSSVFGGKKRREKVQKAKQEAMQRTIGLQNQFNTANLGFSQNQAAMQEQSRLQTERNNRLYNIPQQYSNLY